MQAQGGATKEAQRTAKPVHIDHREGPGRACRAVGGAVRQLLADADATAPSGSVVQPRTRITAFASSIWSAQRLSNGTSRRGQFRYQKRWPADGQHLTLRATHRLAGCQINFMIAPESLAGQSIGSTGKN